VPEAVTVPTPEKGGEIASGTFLSFFQIFARRAKI
jgi:hypothetical protein